MSALLLILLILTVLAVSPLVPIGLGICLHFPEVITFISKALETNVFYLASLRREACNMASHRSQGSFWKFPFSGSLPLCSDHQPTTLSLFSKVVTLPNFTVFSLLSISLLFSRVEMKATSTLMVGVRTSHRWHITFLSSYRPDFQALQNHSFPDYQRTLYYAFWGFFWGGASCWC